MAKAKSSVVYQLKITLANIKPPVWRRIEVTDCSLEQLHQIIQLCMGWFGGHLWGFDIGREQYGPDDDEEDEIGIEPASKFKLSQVIAGRIKKFVYTYDFGDNWEHVIEIEKVLEADPKVKYPRCVKGSRACPPEDCGGPWRYAEFLKTIKNPKHPDHKEMLEWIGGEFDPEEFDIEEVNDMMATLR